jgi:hypothetical protein
MEFTLSSKNLVVFSKLIILFTPPSKKIKTKNKTFNIFIFTKLSIEKERREI